MSPWTRGMAWLHCFPCLCRLRTGRCISHRGKSQIYCPEHILGYGRLKDLLLSCRGFWLFLDRLSRFLFGGGGPCTALSLGLRGRGLESQFGWRPRHLGHESDGLVLLVPGVQAGHVFSRYSTRGIDSRIAGRSGTACFVSSTVVRTERGKVEDEKRKSDWLPPA